MELQNLKVNFYCLRSCADENKFRFCKWLFIINFEFETDITYEYIECTANKKHIYNKQLSRSIKTEYK